MAWQNVETVTIFVTMFETHTLPDLCCYKYQALIVSVNVTKCNPDGFNLELLCAVYWPKAIEPFTELTVNWYKSKEQPDLLAGLEGEMIENTTHKYVLTVTQPTVEDYETQSTIGSDTVNSQYFSLGIINFTTDDSGYYWCQMIVNSSCLKPSAYRHIATNTSISRSCSYYDNSYDHLDQSKKFCGNASSSCNAIKHKASDNTTKDSTCFSSKTFYSISGILLLIIVLLLLVIMALCASCFSHKKRTVMPYISNGKCIQSWLA